MEVDLLGDATPTAKADALFHLSKEAIKHRLLDELWQAKVATSPRSLAGIVLSDNVIEAIRKELRWPESSSCTRTIPTSTASA